MKYIRKPIEVEALQWDGSEQCIWDINNWLKGITINDECVYSVLRDGDVIAKFWTGDSDSCMDLNDWVVVDPREASGRVLDNESFNSEYEAKS